MFWEAFLDFLYKAAPLGPVALASSITGAAYGYWNFVERKLNVEAVVLWLVALIGWFGAIWFFFWWVV